MDYRSKLTNFMKSTIAAAGLAALVNCATVNTNKTVQPTDNFWKVCKPGVAEINYLNNAYHFLCACGKSPAGSNIDNSANDAGKMLEDKLGKAPQTPMLLEIWDDKNLNYSVVCVQVARKYDEFDM